MSGKLKLSAVDGEDLAVISAAIQVMASAFFAAS